LAFLWLEGLSRGPEAAVRALDRACGWIKKDLLLVLRQN
jgi:hypothetical protein